jgi:hypothetical protein
MVDNFDWLTPDFYSKAYDRFIRLRWHIDPFPGDDRRLDPEAYRFSPEEYKKAAPLLFGDDLLRLSIQRIIGQINGFNSDLFHLKAWVKILSEYDDQSQKLHLIVEFVEPLVMSCLTAPYALKNQIIFSGTKIAILLDKGGRGQKIPDDKAINFRTFKQWAGTWSGFLLVAKTLSAVNDHDFIDSTHTFRDRYTHQMPPRIAVGIVANYHFEREGKSLKVYPRVDEPLPLSTCIETSIIQHRACVAAFQAFWHMLKAKMAS